MSIKIKLKNPIKINNKELMSFEMREPTAGDLRGIRLVEFLNLNTDTFFDLLPRITEPPLTKAQVAKLSMSDTFQITRVFADLVEGELKNDSTTQEP